MSRCVPLGDNSASPLQEELRGMIGAGRAAAGTLYVCHSQEGEGHSGCEEDIHILGKEGQVTAYVYV